MAFQICFLQEPDFTSKQIILEGRKKSVFQKSLRAFSILPFYVNKISFIIDADH